MRIHVSSERSVLVTAVSVAVAAILAIAAFNETPRCGPTSSAGPTISGFKIKGC